MWTKKDFQLVADVTKNINDKDTRQSVAMNFAHRFAADNPRFDISRFVKACGA